MSYKLLAELILQAAGDGVKGVTTLRGLRRDHPDLWGHAVILAGDMLRDLVYIAEVETGALEVASCG
jgi:hypothetical protein